MKTTLLASALTLMTAAAVQATPVAYELDASHSQIVFSYDHLGFSTTYGMFSGFEGDILFDEEDPAASSVEVSFPVTSLFTGWEARFKHFMNEDLFNAEVNPDVSFVSTEIEVTGEATALITGDLTMNGITKPVVLVAEMNKKAMQPMKQKPWIGFDATTTVLRSDYGLGMAVPYVSDEVEIRISIEAAQVE